jgi:PPM family protein phosphatase
MNCLPNKNLSLSFANTVAPIKYVGGAGHIGLRRTKNDDVFGLCGNSDCVLGFVADGVGGSSYGDVASQLIFETINKHLKSESFGKNTKDPSTWRRMLKLLVHQCKTSLLNAVDDDPARMDMASTLTVLITNGMEFEFAHIGDSRLYLLTNHQLVQISNDHTLAALLEKAGQLSVEQILSHPSKHVLVQSLNAKEKCVNDGVQVGGGVLTPGDKLMLCTDGLSDMVDDDDITRLLLNTSGDSLLNKLIASALEAGGKDNIAVVCIEVAVSEPIQQIDI